MVSPRPASLRGSCRRARRRARLLTAIGLALLIGASAIPAVAAPRAPALEDWRQEQALLVGTVSPAGLAGFEQALAATASARGRREWSLARALPQALVGVDLISPDGWRAAGLDPLAGAGVSARVIGVATIANLAGATTMAVLRARLVFSIADHTLLDATLSRLARLVPGAVVLDGPTPPAGQRLGGLASDTADRWWRLLHARGARLMVPQDQRTLLVRVVGDVVVLEALAPLVAADSPGWFGVLVPEDAVATPKASRRRGGRRAALTPTAGPTAGAVWLRLASDELTTLVPTSSRCAALTTAIKESPFSTMELRLDAAADLPSLILAWSKRSTASRDAPIPAAAAPDPAGAAASATAVALPTGVLGPGTAAALAVTVAGWAHWLVTVPPTTASVWGALRTWPECGRYGAAVLGGGGWAAVLARWLRDAYAIDPGVKEVAEGTPHSGGVLSSQGVLAAESTVSPAALGQLSRFFDLIFGEARTARGERRWGTGPLAVHQRPAGGGAAGAALPTVGAIYAAQAAEPSRAKVASAARALVHSLAPSATADAADATGSRQRLLHARIAPAALAAVLGLSPLSPATLLARAFEAVELRVERDGSAVSATLSLDLL